MKVGDQNRQTHIRFRNFTDYETCISSIDQDYESEDAIFNDCIYKLNTPQFNIVNRSRYGNGCNFQQHILEYQAKNCYIPSDGYSFLNCFNSLTGKDCKEHQLDFIRIEQRRSNIMTMAHIQQCLRKLHNNLGYYNEKKYGLDM